jgi:hypothetical protein
MTAHHHRSRLFAATDFGLARIHYETVRGRVSITVARPHPDAMLADLRVLIGLADWCWRVLGFRTRAVRRPLHFG